MEEKAEEKDLKMKFEAELEEKRSTQERNHEERMQSMLVGYMTHMMSMISGSRVPSPFPSSHQVQATYHLFPHTNVYLPLTLSLNHTLLISLSVNRLWDRLWSLPRF